MVVPRRIITSAFSARLNWALRTVISASIGITLILTVDNIVDEDFKPFIPIFAIFSCNKNLGATLDVQMSIGLSVLVFTLPLIGISTAFHSFHYVIPIVQSVIVLFIAHSPLLAIASKMIGCLLTFLIMNLPSRTDEDAYIFGLHLALSILIGLMCGLFTALLPIPYFRNGKYIPTSLYLLEDQVRQVNHSIAEFLLACLDITGNNKPTGISLMNVKFRNINQSVDSINLLIDSSKFEVLFLKYLDADYCKMLSSFVYLIRHQLKYLAALKTSIEGRLSENIDIVQQIFLKHLSNPLKEITLVISDLTSFETTAHQYDLKDLRHQKKLVLHSFRKARHLIWQSNNEIYSMIRTASQHSSSQEEKATELNNNPVGSPASSPQLIHQVASCDLEIKENKESSKLCMYHARRSNFVINLLRLAADVESWVNKFSSDSNVIENIMEFTPSNFPTKSKFDLYQSSALWTFKAFKKPIKISLVLLISSILVQIDAVYDSEPQIYWIGVTVCFVIQEDKVADSVIRCLNRLVGTVLASIYCLIILYQISTDLTVMSALIIAFISVVSLFRSSNVYSYAATVACFTPPLLIYATSIKFDDPTLVFEQVVIARVEFTTLGTLLYLIVEISIFPYKSSTCITEMRSKALDHLAKLINYAHNELDELFSTELSESQFTTDISSRYLIEDVSRTEYENIRILSNISEKYLDDYYKYNNSVFKISNLISKPNIEPSLMTNLTFPEYEAFDSVYYQKLTVIYAHQILLESMSLNATRDEICSAEVPEIVSNIIRYLSEQLSIISQQIQHCADISSAFQSRRSFESSCKQQLEVTPELIVSFLFQLQMNKLNVEKEWTEFFYLCTSKSHNTENYTFVVSLSLNSLVFNIYGCIESCVSFAKAILQVLIYERNVIDESR